MPFFLPSDRDALDFGLGHLGRPEPEEQSLVWIRNTQELGRIAVSEALVPQVAALSGWRLAPESFAPAVRRQGKSHLALSKRVAAATTSCRGLFGRGAPLRRSRRRAVKALPYEARVQVPGLSRLKGTTMQNNDHVPLARFRLLERVSASVPELPHLEDEIQRALAALQLPSEKLKGRRIAVTAGSRGIANLREIVRAICTWLKAQGAQPFVFPAMGSHGGATAEGQRQILEDYGVTAEQVGAEIRSSMETVVIGTTPEGFKVYLDRNAWEADGIVVMNRIKPHTDFSGEVESGLLKMVAVGMGKKEGATQTHRQGWKYGFETVIRSLSAVTLASGKILCGLGNRKRVAPDLRRAGQPPGGDRGQRREGSGRARALVPRIPLPGFQVLMVDEVGKNVSGTGMDTKVIGRGVKLRPGEAPEIGLIYARDLTEETAGNALGIGLADLMHERVYRKIDLQKTHVNARVQMLPPMARLPFFLPSDREALDFGLGHLGRPEPEEQRLCGFVIP